MRTHTHTQCVFRPVVSGLGGTRFFFCFTIFNYLNAVILSCKYFAFVSGIRQLLLQRFSFFIDTEVILFGFFCALCFCSLIVVNERMDLYVLLIYATYDELMYFCPSLPGHSCEKRFLFFLVK